jgi:hypothetical protein
MKNLNNPSFLFKHFAAFIALFTCFFTAQAQDLLNDQVSLEPGYSNMVFYSFSEGLTGTAEQAAWDLAFDVAPMGTGIRINGGLGAELFFYGTGEDWDTADTTDWVQSETLRNESSSWDMGAFNQGGDGMFDLGWGVYDLVTHVVSGDKVYLYYAPDGGVKKVQIQSLDLEIYSFKFADLDGENLVEMTIDKADYVGRNMVYLNLVTTEVLDLEPLNWDVMFFRYMENVGGGMFYSVVGGLVNRGVEVQELSELLDPTVDGTYDLEAFSDLTNEIGSDWKSYTPGVGYSLVADRAYFVKNAGGSVWRLVFSAFEGSTTGVIGFDYALAYDASVAVETSTLLHEFSIYPNPVRSNQNFTVTSTAPVQSVRFMDSAGRLIWSAGFDFSVQSLIVPGTGLRGGVHIVEIQTDLGVQRVPLIVD